jgi:DNA (cytosine-5)-methyltransferase 1
MAGYRELLAVEWDDNAVETFGLNFPGVPVYHGDIAKLSVEECLERTVLQHGELDVLDGSPPCQGFSTAGKRDFGDERNQLFREYVRLLRGLRPRVFIMENVSGMIKGKMKLIFVEILRELKASGYKVSARLMNAMYFNVPQSRERMIFVGVREDLRVVLSHPRGIHRPWCAACAVQGIEDTHNPYGPRKFNQARRYLRHHEPSPTLTKSEVPGSDLPFLDGVRIGDKRAAVIASFPSSFRFAGKWTDAVNRIANSVPPLMMRDIAAGLSCTRVE